MQVLESWDPLSLPRGSIRALITLTLLGVLWTLMILDREIPLPLAFIVLLAMGHYFGSRAGKTSESGVKQPLFLPRGSIRLVIVGGFAAVGYHLYTEGRLPHDLESRTGAVFFSLAALTAGFLVRKLADLISQGQMTRWRRLFENVKAIFALVATIIFAIFCLTRAKEPGIENLALVSVPLIVFYFGSRS